MLTICTLLSTDRKSGLSGHLNDGNAVEIWLIGHLISMLAYERISKEIRNTAECALAQKLTGQYFNAR